MITWITQAWVSGLFGKNGKILNYMAEKYPNTIVKETGLSLLHIACARANYKIVEKLLNMTDIKTKEINILPDRSLMPKIGQTGYSVSQAISELVDNSIDAREDGIALTVEIYLDDKKNTIEVSDNGFGMNEQTAANSIKLAHSGKQNKLGEFGLGLERQAVVGRRD